jgi:hypothetical protein
MRMSGLHSFTGLVMNVPIIAKSIFTRNAAEAAGKAVNR